MQQVLDDQTVEDILHGLELMTNPAMSSVPTGLQSPSLSTKRL